MSNPFWPPWTTAPQGPLSSSVSQFAQIHVHLSQWCCLTISSSASPFSFSLSLFQHQGLFQWVGFSHQVVKVLEHQSFQSFSISPSKEYSGLISFRIDWFDLHAVQGTLKNLLQHHDLKASVLQRSAFLMVQLSHPYMTTGKTIALTWWTFVGKECLCFLICYLDWS